MSTSGARVVQIELEVSLAEAGWELDDDEERMPENPLQLAICRLLMDVLDAWVEARKADAMVGGNIALRWDATHPKVGVDPDVYLVEPAPPMDVNDKSIRTWIAGHSPPRVAIEVVSRATADEDYNSKPQKYAASGTRELWVFDPLYLGPRGGTAHRIQVWRRNERGVFRRVYAGDGPAQSAEFNAWVVVTDGGLRLRIANDAAGADLWLTSTERERAEKERERAEKERERAEKDSALAELAKLRAELARLR